VAGRQALVKRLRVDGDRERAAEVAGLRRPTAAAWAVNQLARRHGDEVGALLSLGDDLRRAHERLLDGGRDDTTVMSGRRRREAIADLVERAAGILTESGRTADAHRDAISATLDAASLDPDVAADVVAGRLSKELDPPSGFGEFDWTTAAAPARSAVTRPAPAKSPAAAKAPTGKAKDPSAADVEAQRAAERQARRREEARQRAESARTAATRARALADQAREAAERADAELERLEAEVIRARKTAVDSRRASRELRDAAHEAERQADALERDAGL
jgi:hypothetical protein